MEIDTWYKWMLVYFYDGGGILLMVATSILAWKYRTFTLYLAAIAMFGFVVGGFAQSSAQRAFIEAQQTMQDQSGIIFEYYAWRAISSVGFVLGGASLLWFAVKNRGSNNGKVNNP
jgi:hypothetical protein